MKIKNYFILGLCCLMVISIYGQNRAAFYIEIPNKNNVPVVTHSKKAVRIAFSKNPNAVLNKVINSYEIYRCIKAFESSKKSKLQHIYIIECNDINLKNELTSKFKEKYPSASKIDITSYVTPNDYGTNGGLLIDQSELDYIRAPETWDITTGSDNVVIGISDTNFTPNHEELLNTLSIEAYESMNNINGHQHGSWVSSVAGGDTNNNAGMSSIGYKSKIYAGVGNSYLFNAVNAIHALSAFTEVKVVNASWGTHATSDGIPDPPIFSENEESIFEEITNDRQVIVVAAAGNGESNPGDPTLYSFPASYKDVISVSSVGHADKTWTATLNGTIHNYQSFKDRHQYIDNGQLYSHQHNDSIDIVAPGYGVLMADPINGSTNTYLIENGTSFAAPIVTGTVALMFAVNYDIDPKEVETILKLTAVKVDTIPENLLFYGKLGAGRLDAYEAVKMAKDMADVTGTVEVKDRILYRPWFYKLVTSPYEIKMTNNDVKGSSKLKFKARNNIELVSGYYGPETTTGYIDLSIDPNMPLAGLPPPGGSGSKVANSKGKEAEEITTGPETFMVYPNPVSGLLNIVNKEEFTTLEIVDMTRKVVFKAEELNTNATIVDIGSLNSGIYFLNIKLNTGLTKTKKIVKD